MRLCYVLLSPTFGMHLYTADLANRMLQAGHEVHLVTTRSAPRECYAPDIRIHASVDLHTRGFSREALRLASLQAIRRDIDRVAPDVVHITGPHLWNVLITAALVEHGVPVLHTLHDLHPHQGMRGGRLLYLWNWLIIRHASHLLVHGDCYRQQLLSIGVSADRVTYTPLLFLFTSYEAQVTTQQLAATVEYQPWALCFGRLSPYKGIPILLTACDLMDRGTGTPLRAILAGPGPVERLWAGPLPRNVEVRDRPIGDAEAIDLFRRCGLIVVPYIDATQSAQIAAAYFFHKPVVVTRVGALPEYVVDEYTGVVVEPGHPAILARTLEHLLDNPTTLAQMGTAGRAWYNQQRMLEQRTIFALYRRLAGPQPAGGLVASFSH